MIIVTGALGFIGSALLGELEARGYGELVAVDNFDDAYKFSNLDGKKIKERIDRTVFCEWLSLNASKVQFVFHIGARTRTNEFDWNVLNDLNLNYSKQLWQICSQESIPLIYASSAATYGNGENGFSDDPANIKQLKPMNPYGESKQLFDLWMLEQENTPPFWAGFKFFNVFGPNEYHKGRMASVVFHAFNQIKERGSVNLFKSYNSEYADGEQRRDFVYIKDVLNVLIYHMETRKKSGLYNLGSGKSHTFLDLATGVFKALNLESNLNYIDMPEDIRDNYQYFTQADDVRLVESGYSKGFTPFDEAIADYVTQYLVPHKYI
jgi:ADP-L-glycero-D-manno-heptose 6-epimerase